MIKSLLDFHAFNCGKGYALKRIAHRLRSVIAVCMFAMCAIFVSAQTAEPVKLYGSIRYSDSPEGFDWGIYSWQATDPVVFTPEIISGDLMATGGAVYAFGKYYIVSYLEFGGMYFGMLLTCDLETKDYDFVDIADFDISYVTSDMTFDPQTGNVYACSLDKDGSGSTNLSIFNTTDGSQSVIAPMPTMCGLAAAADGTLYGIGLADGILYTIDKTNAQLTEVGHTGVTPEKIQTATIDQNTGVMYWSAYTAEGGALYTVDLATGAATLVGKYPNGEQMCGMFVLEEKNQTPDAPTDFAVAFEKASLEGAVTMKLPVDGLDGNPLSGELVYTVFVENAKAAEGVGQPGEEVSVPVSVTAAGEYLFSAQASNEGGAGPSCSVRKYVGMDIPVIADLKAKADGGNVVLSWRTLETGKNNGYVDTAAVTYKIVRMPDDIIVAEEFGDTLFVDAINPETMCVAFYDVTPAVEKAGAGETKQSGYVRVGESLSVPFSHDFLLWSNFSLYDVIDVNNDYCTWTYDTYLMRTRLDWPFGEAYDDWMITPPVNLEKDKTYQVVCAIASEADEYSSNVEVRLGKTNSADDFLQPVIPETAIDYEQMKEITSENFSVNADGVYYFGIHGCGAYSYYYTFINSFAVNEVTVSGINTVEDGVSATIAVNGNMVTVENPEGTECFIYNASGMQVAADSGKSFKVTLAPGIYILRTAGASTKFCVAR